MDILKSFKNIVLLCLFCMAFGYWICLQTSTKTDRIEYVKEEPVTGAITNPVPVSEEIPEKSVLPVRRDTLYKDNIIYVREAVDTAAIILDYEKRRNYLIPLFDNQYGKLDMSMSAQYNKISDLSYTFVPIRTVQYVSVKKIWQPYVSTSYSTFNIAGIGAGMFYHNAALEYQYLRRFPDSRSGHMLAVKWKF